MGGRATIRVCDDHLSDTLHDLENRGAVIVGTRKIQRRDDNKAVYFCHRKPCKNPATTAIDFTPRYEFVHKDTPEPAQVVKMIKQKYAQVFELLGEYDKGKLNWRMDGRLEWVCKHGVGHTIYVPPEHENDEAWWAHGCDGCCKIFWEGNDDGS